jgi:ATP-binding cassette subfamily C protein
MALGATFKRSWQILNKSQKRKIIFAIFFQGLLNLLDLAGVTFLTLTTYLLTNGSLPNLAIFNSFGSLKTESLAFTLIAVTILLFTLKGVLSPFFISRTMKFLTGISVDFSTKLTRDFFSRPRTFLQRYNSQEVVFSLSQGVTAAINEIIGSTVLLISEIVLMFLLVALMIYSNFALSIANFVLFGVTLYLLNKIIGREQFTNTKTRVDSVLRGNSSLLDIIATYREIFASRKMDFFLSEFRLIRNQESKAASYGLVLNAIPKYIFEVIFYLGSGFILFFLYTFSDSDHAFSIFVLFVASGSRILPSILRIQTSLANIRTNEALSNYTFSLLSDLESSRITSKIFKPLINGQSNRNLLKIEGLKFKYDDKPEWELNIESLVLPRNMKIAFVGPSGSGKSTLVDLILGVLSPAEGKIEFFSDNTKPEFDSQENQIAYMPQDISILSRSLRENVAIGLPQSEIQDELVLESLKKSGLIGMIENFPNGIYEALGENGSNLSGGQRQRIGFARVLYQQPKILILDESTSALDSESEFLISESINTLGDHMSIISIAHRLSTIKDYDLILYFENGKVSQMGTFEEVRAKSRNFNNQAQLLGL